MTEDEIYLLSIMLQAKANVECEDVNVSPSQFIRVFERNMESSKENSKPNSNLQSEKQFVKERKFINGKRQSMG